MENTQNSQPTPTATPPTPEASQPNEMPTTPQAQPSSPSTLSSSPLSNTIPSKKSPLSIATIIILGLVVLDIILILFIAVNLADK